MAERTQILKRSCEHTHETWKRENADDDGDGDGEAEESSGTVLLFRAQLAGVAPALSGQEATATLGFAGVERLRDRALAILKACETEALSSVWHNKQQAYP